MRGINMLMKPGHPIFMLFLYITVLGLIIIFRFPKTANDLQLIQINDTISTAEGDLLVIDIAHTDHQTSWYYLTKGNDGNRYMIEARQFPFVRRYEISRPMLLSINEIFKTSDYYTDISIVNNGNALDLTEKKNLSPTLYSSILLLLFIVGNIIYTYYKQKRQSLK